VTLRIESHPGGLALAVEGWLGAELAAEDGRKALEALPAGDLVEVLLDSRGGLASAALILADRLGRARARGVRVRVRVPPTGQALSAATVLLASASPGLAVLGRGSRVLTHAPRDDVTGGTARDMAGAAKRLRRLARELALVYAARSRRSVAWWLRLMNWGDTWLSPAEAVRLGLADMAEG
jgi:ATP-dependent protease ClpP protease subunit